MPVLLRSMDLDEIFDEENISGWVADSAQNGRVFYGYSGNAYIHCEYDAAELYSIIIKDKAEQKNELVSFDIQVSGSCVWNLRYSEIALKNDIPYDMTRLAVVKHPESGGFTVMHLLNADILPSFLEDDEIAAQVVAFAVNVHYYENEDALAETIPECEGMKIEELNGQKILPAMGSVLPTGFMHDHMVREDGQTLDQDEDDELVSITGIVKHIYVDSVKLKGDEIARFLRTRIDTQYGELDIVHSRPMIADDEFKFLKSCDFSKQEVIIQAVGVLSGDVAINEYENGVVKDRNNDLAALRYALIKGNAERLASILDENVTYESIHSSQKIVGSDSVINHINDVHNNTTIKYIAHFATIDDGSDERCIILAENQDDNYQSMVRIVVSDEGLITRIIVTNDSAIMFVVDEKPYYKGLWDDEYDE